MFRLVARDDPNLVVLYVALASLNAIGLVAVWCSHALLLAAYRFLVIANFIATTSHIPFFFFAARYGLDAWMYYLAGDLKERVSVAWFSVKSSTSGQ